MLGEPCGVSTKKSIAPIRKQYKILIISLGLAFLGGGTNYFLCFRIDMPPYGNILASLFIFGVFFLILRYQIMDIRITLSRSFVYAIIIFMITLSYFATTYLIQINLQEMVGYKSFLLSFICASITAIAFVPVKDSLQKITDKYFFKKSIKEIEQENVLLKHEITQSERLKSIAILASGIAHEIKNPLTPLRTFSEYLPSKINDQEFLKKFSPIITHEISRIDKLVHELLDFAKPSPAILSPTNIYFIINDTLDFLSNDLLKKKINITQEHQTENTTLLNLDRNQFKQAIFNIILNAIDAMPQGGTLTISTETKDNDFYLRIKDTGCGISPKDIPHIFDPFFTKKDHGTGLGLSVTHEIIKNHGGKIFVESKKGFGTTFTIRLAIQ